MVKAESPTDGFVEAIEAVKDAKDVKLAFVTGGATRVGAVLTKTLVNAGYSVIVHCHKSSASAEQLRDELGGAVMAIVEGDLSDPEQLKLVGDRVQQLCEPYGLSLLVHNAANFERIEPAQLDLAAWDRAMALNARAPFALTLALQNELKRSHGTVVAITCTSAEKPWKNYAAYSVSKAALKHSMETLALVLAPEVRTGCVAPGTVLAPDSYTDEQRTKMKAKLPLERFGDAQQIANAVLFIAQNDFVTGTTITVDGGRVLV